MIKIRSEWLKECGMPELKETVNKVNAAQLVPNRYK